MHSKLRHCWVQPLPFVSALCVAVSEQVEAVPTLHNAVLCRC